MYDKVLKRGIGAQQMDRYSSSRNNRNQGTTKMNSNGAKEMTLYDPEIQFYSVCYFVWDECSALSAMGHFRELSKSMEGI